MTVQTKLRVKNGVLTCKLQNSAGAFNAPSASANAIRVEDASISISPNLIQTNEWTASLDPNAPFVAGQKYSISTSLYLRGSGVPGTAPEWAPLAKISSLAETITKTDITAVDISTNNSTHKILAASTDITALTVGTVFYASGFANAANNGEFVVATVGSGFVTVTDIAGATPTLVTESAGASVTLRYGIPGTAATAGTTTSATLASPFAATAQLYRFMPAFVSGNPATPFTTFIRDYTVGRVITTADLFGSALTTSSIVSIPANVTYVQGSGSIPWGSVEIYGDGKRWQFVDCIGKMSEQWSAAGTVKVSLTLEGKFYAENDIALPAPTYDASKPGVWRGSRFLLDRTAVALNTMGIDFSTTNVFPPNPNDTEGFDAPFHDSRNVSGSIDPFMGLVATRAAITEMRAGTRKAILATLQGAPGGTAGNRVARQVPSAVYTNAAPGKSGGLYTDNTPFFCEGQDSGTGLAIW